jgi:hypothetical protein
LRREEDESGRREAGGDEARAAVGDAPAPDQTPRAGPLAQPWLLAACLCLLAAALCLVLGYFDAAFVAAALGAIAWFLNVRSKLPRPPEEDDEDNLDDEQE